MRLDGLDVRMNSGLHLFDILNGFYTSSESILPCRINGLPSFIDDLRVSGNNIELLLMLVHHVIVLGLGLVDKLIGLLLRPMKVEMRLNTR